MSEQHLRPFAGEGSTAGAEPPIGPGPEGNPWERRGELGRGRAFVRAVWLWIVAPTRAYDETRRRGGFRGPLLFALWMSLAAGLLSGLTDAFYELSAAPQGSGGLREVFDLSIEGERVEGLEWLPSSLLSLLSAGGCIVGVLVGIPVFLIVFPVVILLWSGTLHVGLRLVGGLSRSESGYQGTWAAVCYALVALLGDAVPVVGEWLSFVWLGVLQAIGFRKLHRTSLARAMAALLLPFALVAILWLLKWAGWIGQGEAAAVELVLG